MSVHFVIILIFMKYSYMIIHTLQTSTDEISHKILDRFNIDKGTFQRRI